MIDESLLLASVKPYRAVATASIRPYTSHLPSLDGLRAVAILLVLVCHLELSQNPPARLLATVSGIDIGATGVRIFFVLSGFLITHLMLREERRIGHLSLSAFYRRRTVRILPVYFVYLIVLALLISADLLREPLGSFVQPLTFTTGLWPNMPLFYGHLWSLAVEEQFYLAWPLIFVATSGRWRLAIAVAAIAAGPISRLVLHFLHQYQLNQFSIFGNGDTLAWGCLLAMAIDQRSGTIGRIIGWRPSLGRTTAVLCIVGVAVVEGIPGFRTATLPFGRSMQAVAVAYLIASLIEIRSGVLYFLMNLRIVALLGSLSYSVYIWQQLFLCYNAKDPRPHLWQAWPYNLPLAILVAICSYYGVERPLLRFKNAPCRTARRMVPV